MKKKDVTSALSLYEQMRHMKVALVTNHRYKKFARTGHPSGPTKFSFLFYSCDAGEGIEHPHGVKTTRTIRVRSVRRQQLGEEARLRERECKIKMSPFDAHFLLISRADVAH